MTEQINDIHQQNRKIYKYYSFMKPQGCALSPLVEKDKIENLIKKNFIKRAPNLTTNHDQLNSTFLMNSNWLYDCFLDKELNKPKSILAKSRLERFLKQKKQTFSLLFSHYKSKISKKQIEQKSNEIVENKPKRQRLMRRFQEPNEMLSQTQIIVPQKSSVLQDPIVIINKEEEKKQILPKIKVVKRKVTKLDQSDQLISECTFYRSDVNKSSQEILDFQQSMNSSIISLIDQLIPKKAKNDEIDKLRLKKTEAVHNYLVFSDNETKSKGQSQLQSPENKLMMQYETRLFHPNIYSQFLFNQRRKQFKKDSQLVKAHRFVDDKKLVKLLKVK